ncbi:fimbria/pilus outer membrane usher protein [Collimonas antrihumi]|uniref:fimbria/pilus outer membrane usher protein n=1 Tax=Collimonas antrihumi TaxID=1940615 RepID=UPI001B8CD83C|nr:fimbria/pilus outer membrane usher protein [Collimonas antrihumi]
MNRSSALSTARTSRHKRTDYAVCQPRLLSMLVSGAIASMLAPSAIASTAIPMAAAAMKFDSGFFPGGFSTTPVDVSRFEVANVVLPGTYRVDISVNQNRQGREDVTFSTLPDQDNAVPCFDRATLIRFGVDPDKVARGEGSRSVEDVAAHQIPDGPLCGDLSTWIPGATVVFDAGEQSLEISIPQIFMDRSARGYVDPSLLDSGVTAGILGYNFSTSTATGSGRGTQAYLGLNAGVNVGDWRLRHQGAINWNSQSGAVPYQNTATNIQRDITALKSQLIIGDTFTTGQILDSARIRGVTLSTDDRQLPHSQQGYAPVVRGAAESNARVTVSQNGYTIYETTVSPGPFVIDDLYPTGYGGDLLVTVTEADGRKSTFSVPYAAVPQLLRPGVTKYSVSAGQLKQYGINAEPFVMQAAVQHGVNNIVTVYGGLIASEGYMQAKGGAAISTPIGAVAIDASTSSTQVPGGGSTLAGQSFGITYSKNIPETGTNFALGAYRFSTAGYLGLQDAANLRDMADRGLDTSGVSRQRSRLDLNISQKVGAGSLFLSGSATDYWGGSVGRQTSYSAGYGSSWRKINWNVSVQRSLAQAATLTPEQLRQQQFDNVFYGAGANNSRAGSSIMLSLSMPLGNAGRAPTLNSSMTRNTGDNKGSNLQVGVSGTANEDRTITYGVSGNHNDSGNSRSSTFNGNLGYQGSVATLNSGISQSGNTGQISFSASGGVVAHPGGVSLAQTLGDTIGVVHAPDAEGAAVGGTVGVTIDRHGYAVVPNLQSYQNNAITIDPKGSSSDIEFKDTSKTVAPRLGSVVMVGFETDNSRAVVLKVTRADGASLPFAAEVFDAAGKVVGVVGQGSKAFVRGVEDSGTLTVKWGSTADSQCQVAYQLPAPVKGKIIADIVQGQCMNGEISADENSTPLGSTEKSMNAKENSSF